MSKVAAPARPKAVFLTSTKGGPGKSTAASLLLDNWRSQNLATHAYDADASNASLVQHYGTKGLDGRLIDLQDPVKGCALVNVRQPNSRDELLNAVERAKAARILVDLPGGGAEDVASVLPNADDFFQAFIDYGFEPVVGIVISHVKASAAAVAATIETFGKRPSYVVIKNLGHGAVDFPYFDGLEINGEMRYLGAKRALESVHGSVITMPALQIQTYARWDAADCTIAEALTHPFMTLSDKMRIKSWRADFAKAIAESPLA
jgi:hypothetical protein